MTSNPALSQADGFTRTLQTAKDADGVVALLERAAKRAGAGGPGSDRERLTNLAERYRDYAQALRETAASQPEEPAADQAVLI